MFAFSGGATLYLIIAGGGFVLWANHLLLTPGNAGTRSWASHAASYPIHLITLSHSNSKLSSKLHGKLTASLY